MSDSKNVENTFTIVEEQQKRYGVQYKLISEQYKEKIAHLVVGVKNKVDSISTKDIIVQLVKICYINKIPYIKLLEYDIDTISQIVTDMYLNNKI